MKSQGLLNAMRKEHMIHHVFLNMSLHMKLTNDDRNLIYAAADALTTDIADSVLVRILNQHTKAWKYLVDIKPGHTAWCQAFIVAVGFPTFGIKTSNAAEVNNAWLGMFPRASDPVSAMYMLMTKILKKFAKRREELTQQDPKSLVSIIQPEVEANMEKSKEYKEL
ncbi:Aste57867_3331 [Aphanomyces stellatus]|uniref:Aste57867_3331 protein n=1 Tax=Aphanomyces stellatus TaxID=120398 RepID=A0A485KDV2_9STRA|nr:hypothetical protein As57867_003321 [Aphanomyces stellatus]VFT80501.1 Aste57867_3331 [Aphanomyces stellatus]